MAIVRPNSNMLFMNLISPASSSLSDGGGGGAYVAKAVHFDGATYLGRDSLVGVTDSPIFLLSVWINEAQDTNNITATFPNGSFGALYSSGTTPPNAMQMQLADYQFNNFLFPNAASVGLMQSWQHYLVSCDVSEDDPNKVVQILLNGTSSLVYTPDTIPGFTIGYEDETNFYIGWDGYSSSKITADMCDFQFWPNKLLDLTNQSNVELFIKNGKPVDPALAAIVLGTSSVLCSGDALSFATNQGTGGAFTLTGALTNADTSPSD